MAANKNICDCPDPPGGRAVCESHQLAICRVKDGVAQTECIDPPSDVTGLALENWALSVITGVSRQRFAQLSRTDQDILRSGTYYDPRTRTTVSFKLPVS